MYFDCGYHCNKRPGSVSVYSVMCKKIPLQQGRLFVTYCRYTVIIAMVSYQFFLINIDRYISVDISAAIVRSPTIDVS